LHRDSDREDALHTLPHGLFETYNRVLDRITKVPENLHIAKKVLSWLFCCQRPLSLAELAYAIAIDPDDLLFNDKKKLDDDEIILGDLSCMTKLNSVTHVVEFAHFTVRQFFASSNLPNGEKNQYFIESAHANEEICKACIIYLSSPPFNSGPSSTMEDYNIRMATHPFLAYAAKYWPTHALASNTLLHNEWIINFLKRIPALVSWAQMWDMLDDSGGSEQ